jgi:alkaline phosphatase D
MGRPFKSNPRRAGASRREVFKRGGALTAALLAGPLVPVGHASAQSRRSAELFQHGVASGDPLVDRVILWTRVSPEAAATTVVVEYRVAADPSMTRIVQRGRVRTDASRDHTVKVDAAGLQPGATYYYQFSAQGVASPVGRTRTLPEGPTARLRMAVASCSNHAYGYFNAYRQIALRADLDVVVHLGDYLYEYGDGVYGNARATEPAVEIVTLADYRARHAQYKRDADLQAVHRQHPMIAIWDDHEIANDAWRDSAQNHTEATEGAWGARVAAGLQAYYEWMPVRVVDTGELRRDNRSFRFGDLLDLTMLEERLSARSQQLPATVATPLGAGFTQTGPFADPSRTLLGADQEQWLFTALRAPGTRWKFIGQGVMFAQLKGVAAANAAGGGAFLNSDQWDGYQPARDRIYAALAGSNGTAPLDNVVVLTGDIHSSWAADLTPDPNNPDVASGGYQPATGAGSRAVEFVGTSITSPGVDDPGNGIANYLRSLNPHFKYVDLNRRGYMLIDVTHERAVCEWWYVDTVASISHVQSFGVAFEARAGSNRLTASAQTPTRTDAPPLAP